MFAKIIVYPFKNYCYIVGAAKLRSSIDVVLLFDRERTTFTAVRKTGGDPRN